MTIPIIWVQIYSVIAVVVFVIALFAIDEPDTYGKVFLSFILGCSWLPCLVGVIFVGMMIFLEDFYEFLRKKC